MPKARREEQIHVHISGYNYPKYTKWQSFHNSLVQWGGTQWEPSVWDNPGLRCSLLCRQTLASKKAWPWSRTDDWPLLTSRLSNTVWCPSFSPHTHLLLTSHSPPSHLTLTSFSPHTHLLLTSHSPPSYLTVTSLILVCVIWTMYLVGDRRCHVTTQALT